MRDVWGYEGCERTYTGKEEDQVDDGAEGSDEARLDGHCMLLVSETFPRYELARTHVG